MKFGDMQIVGEPSAKLIKALAVIAFKLHKHFNDEKWGIDPGKSKRSCVLSSLATRDFLFKIGFRDAELTPVFLLIGAKDKDGNDIHSLGIGRVDMKEVRQNSNAGTGWSGHMVVSIPSEGFIVDTTLFQAQRDAWPDLPGMMAVPLMRDEEPFWGLYPIAGLGAEGDDGRNVSMIWLDQPENNLWKRAPDNSKRRRENVVAKLVKDFGVWKDKAA